MKSTASEWSRGGTVWSGSMRVNSVCTNDQWMPLLAAKPDETQLFLAWYDRRNDTNNALIDVYGCFGTISASGSVSLTSEFKITTTSIPAVFAGTLTSNTNQGHYDPVYPPELFNLHWWHPDFRFQRKEESSLRRLARQGREQEQQCGCTLRRVH